MFIHMPTIQTMIPSLKSFCTAILTSFLIVIANISISDSTFAQSKDSYKIGFIFDILPENAPVLIGAMQNEIRSVVGQDANIEFPTSGIYVNDFDLDKARVNYQAILENEEIDIIVAFGVISNVIITGADSHSKPTILFGTLASDFGRATEDNETSGIENLSLILASYSIRKDLNVFHELINFQKAGIVVEEYALELLPMRDLLDSTFEELGSEYSIISFNDVDEIKNQLQDIDAVYFANTFYFTDQQIRELSEYMIELGIPSYTSAGSNDVELGIMASSQTDDNIDQFFRRIALNIEAIVNGANAGDLPTYLDTNEQLILNFNTASKVGGPLKYSLIYNTKVVGEMKNVLSEKDYSLFEVLNEAKERNLSVQNSSLDVDLIEQDVKSAISDMFPNLESQLTSSILDPELAKTTNGQNPQFTTTGNLTLSQVLYSQDILTNIYIQKALKSAEESNYQSTELDVILEAASAYFNVLITRSNLEIVIQNLEVTRRNLQIAEQNYEAGLTGRTDVLRFQSQMAQNSQTMVETVSLLEFSFSELNRVLDYPLDREIDVIPIQLSDEVFSEMNIELLKDFLDDVTNRELFIQFLVDEALRNSPELDAFNEQLNIVDASIRLANTGRFVPDVALQGQYNYTFDRSGEGSTYPQGFITPPDGYYSLGISLSLPLFQQNKQNINLQTAKITKNQIDLLIEQTRRNIERQVENNAYETLNQISNMQLSEISLTSAEEVLELTQTAYSNGAVNIIQLIDAQTNLLNAQIANNNALYNFMFSTLALERSIGFYFYELDSIERDQFKLRLSEFINQKN